eukprot:10874139-Prorocentrum_lima.AAC.1
MCVHVVPPPLSPCGVNTSRKNCNVSANFCRSKIQWQPRCIGVWHSRPPTKWCGRGSSTRFKLWPGVVALG